MLTYLSILTVACVLSLFSLFMVPHKRWAVTLPIATMLVIFMGLRDRVSADWPMYVDIFRDYKTLTFAQARDSAGIEIGFGILNAATAAIGGDVHLVALVCAVFMVSGTLYFARFAKLNQSLVLFIACPYLFFVVGMGYTRQSAAIGFAYAAVACYCRKQWWRFALLAALATCLHYSTVLFILFLLAENMKRVLALGALLVVVLSRPVVLAFGTHYLAAYMAGGDSQVNASGVWMRWGMLALVFPVLYLQRNLWSKEPQLYALMKRGAVVILLLGMAAVVASALVDRVLLDFFFIYLLVLARSIEFAPPRFRLLAASFVYSLSFGMFVLWFGMSSFARDYWIPYHFALFAI